MTDIDSATTEKDVTINKVLFAGTVGVGKTTAVKTVSDAAALTTDVKATDATRDIKDSTTVAMDFSAIWLEDWLKVLVYGTPGQARFDFMWSVLSEGSTALVLLVDDSSDTIMEDIQVYLDGFSTLVQQSRLVLGVTRVNSHSDSSDASLKRYRDYFEKRQLSVPVLEADPRSRHDVIVLIRAAIATAQFARTQ